MSRPPGALYHVGMSSLSGPSLLGLRLPDGGATALGHGLSRPTSTDRFAWLDGLSSSGGVALGADVPAAARGLGAAEHAHRVLAELLDVRSD